MVRAEMKVFLYFVAVLLCFGAKRCEADWGKSIEQKRKFVSISNKAMGDALFQCKSNKGNLNKTLKPGEKIRWGVAKKAGEAGPTLICHVDVGSKGGHGYVSMFVEECKKECKWRVFDGGVLKLKLGGGQWKSFALMADEESTRNYEEDDSCDEDDDVRPGKGKQGSGESPAPSPETKSRAPGAESPTKRDEGKLEYGNSPKWESPAPAPLKNSSKWISPAPMSDRAPPPTKHGQRKSGPGNSSAPPPAKSGRRKLKPRNPRSAMLAPMNDKTESRPGNSPTASPMRNSRRKFKPRNPENVKTEPEAPPPTTHDRHKWEAPAPGHVQSPPPQQGGDESDAKLPPLPQPGSTFYTCIKEDCR